MMSSVNMANLPGAPVRGSPSREPEAAENMSRDQHLPAENLPKEAALTLHARSPKIHVWCRYCSVPDSTTLISPTFLLHSTIPTLTIPAFSRRFSDLIPHQQLASNGPSKGH